MKMREEAPARLDTALSDLLAFQSQLGLDAQDHCAFSSDSIQPQCIRRSIDASILSTLSAHVVRRPPSLHERNSLYKRCLNNFLAYPYFVLDYRYLSALDKLSSNIGYHGHYER